MMRSTRPLCLTTLRLAPLTDEEQRMVAQLLNKLS
jgi:hypothetical protein